MKETVNSAQRIATRFRNRDTFSAPDTRTSVKTDSHRRTDTAVGFHARQARTNDAVRALPGMRTFGALKSA
jgi:hypothetical protein